MVITVRRFVKSLLSKEWYSSWIQVPDNAVYWRDIFLPLDEWYRYHYHYMHFHKKEWDFLIFGTTWTERLSDKPIIFGKFVPRSAYIKVFLRVSTSVYSTKFVFWSRYFFIYAIFKKIDETLLAPPSNWDKKRNWTLLLISFPDTLGSNMRVYGNFVPLGKWKMFRYIFVSFIERPWSWREVYHGSHMLLSIFLYHYV